MPIIWNGYFGLLLSAKRVEPAILNDFMHGHVPPVSVIVLTVFSGPVNLLLRSAAAERSNILTYLAISINFFQRSAIAERKRESVALGKEAGGIRSECYFTGSNMPVGQNLLAHRPSRTISV